MTPIVKTIDDPIAPARLIGRKITIILDEKKHNLNFQVDMPDNPTKQEIGYIELTIGEYVEDLRKRHPFIGDKKSAGFITPEKAKE